MRVRVNVNAIYSERKNEVFLNAPPGMRVSVSVNATQVPELLSLAQCGVDVIY